jgi:hypothetical protein
VLWLTFLQLIARAAPPGLKRSRNTVNRTNDCRRMLPRIAETCQNPPSPGTERNQSCGLVKLVACSAKPLGVS